MTQMGLQLPEKLFIRFEPGYQQCNYHCPYCIIGWKGSRNDNWDEDRFKVIIEKLKQLPYDINLLLGVEGEPFTSKLLLDTITDLSHSKNISGIYLITNLSVKKNMLNSFLDKTSETKLSFACTLHSEAIFDEFVEKILLLHDRKIPVIVGSVGEPGKLLKLMGTKRSLKERGIPLYANALLGSHNGRSFPHGYNFFERIILKQLMYSSYEYKYMVKMKNTLGQRCNAGYRYIYLNYDGKVFRCGEEKNKQFESIGDLINGELNLSSSQLRCRSQNCLCPIESFSTLEFQKKYVPSSNRRIYKKKTLVQLVKERFKNDNQE